MSSQTISNYVTALHLKSQMQQAALNAAFRPYDGNMNDPVGHLHLRSMQSMMPKLPKEGHLTADQLYDFVHAARMWYHALKLSIPADTQEKINQILN